MSQGNENCRMIDALIDFDTMCIVYNKIVLFIAGWWEERSTGKAGTGLVSEVEKSFLYKGHKGSIQCTSIVMGTGC